MQELTLPMKIMPSEFYKFPPGLKALEGRWNTQRGPKWLQSSRILQYSRRKQMRDEIHDKIKPDERFKMIFFRQKRD